MDAVRREIDMIPEKYADTDFSGYCVQTVYFGGGTPSILSPDLLGSILCKLNTSFFISENAEITMEANPGTLSKEILPAYREFGINRLSIGLQSADDEELKLLGRIHTWRDFTDNYEAAKRAGFQNINVDIMTALPGQAEATLDKTIEKVLLLEPAHISAYSLIIEEGTLFHEWFKEDGKGEPVQSLLLPDEEQERRMYWHTGDMLREAGYVHYEISNFAKPGFESRHNLSYWTGIDYLGLGLGASSLLSHVRYKNPAELDIYIREPGRQGERLVLEETAQMEEFMFLGLRMQRGVGKREFFSLFHVPVTQVYGKEIIKLKREGLLYEEMGRIALTKRGIDYGNYVFSAFLK